MSTRSDRFNILNAKQTQLDGAIDDSQTTIDVTNGSGSLWAGYPTIVSVAASRSLTDLLASERVLVTDGAGVGDTWTVVRAYDGSSAFVLGLTVAGLFDQLWSHAALLEQLLYRESGEYDHIPLTDQSGGFEDLRVAQNTGADMKFKVAIGYCWINTQPMGLSSVFTSETIVAPVANPRIDLVQASLVGNTITVKTGVEAGSPSAPTVDANCIELASIAFSVAHTPLVDGDITDLRVF